RSAARRTGRWFRERAERPQQPPRGHRGTRRPAARQPARPGAGPRADDAARRGAARGGDHAALPRAGTAPHRGGGAVRLSIVLNGGLAEREGTLRELGVKLVRSIPHELPMVACPMAQLTEMLMKLVDFALRRLRDSQPPRELRIAVTETGPSLTISLWDSGTPLSVEAEQRLVTP